MKCIKYRNTGLMLCIMLVIALGCENNLSVDDQKALDEMVIGNGSDSSLESRLRSMLSGEFEKQGVQLPDNLLDRFVWKVIDNKKRVENKNEAGNVLLQSSASEASVTIQVENTPTCLSGSTTMIQVQYRIHYTHAQVNCNDGLFEIISKLRNAINNDPDAHMTAEIIPGYITFKEKTPGSFANGEDIDITILGSAWQNGQPFDDMSPFLGNGSDGTSDDHPDDDDDYIDPPPPGIITLLAGSDIACHNYFVDMISTSSASQPLDYIAVSGMSWKGLTPLHADGNEAQNSSFVGYGIRVDKSPFDPSALWTQGAYHFWYDAALGGTYSTYTSKSSNC